MKFQQVVNRPFPTNSWMVNFTSITNNLPLGVVLGRPGKGHSWKIFLAKISVSTTNTGIETVSLTGYAGNGLPGNEEGNTNNATALFPSALSEGSFSSWFGGLFSSTLTSPLSWEVSDGILANDNTGVAVVSTIAASFIDTIDVTLAYCLDH